MIGTVDMWNAGHGTSALDIWIHGHLDMSIRGHVESWTCGSVETWTCQHAKGIHTVDGII